MADIPSRYTRRVRPDGWRSGEDMVSLGLLTTGPNTNPGKIMLTSRSMLVLAQTILVFGACSLAFASSKLFGKAVDLGFPSWQVWVILPVAAALGAAKAIFVMRKRMRQNIARLRATTGRLWPWQIYPPQLLAFIVAMVILMNVLKRVLVGSPGGMAALGGVDVAVAAALIIASFEYRR